MGYGVPAPYELLTGSGSMELIGTVLPILEDLLLTERRWVFVPDCLSSLAFSTIAEALNPGEFAIIQKAKPTLDSIAERGHYESTYRKMVRRFVDVAGEQVVIGGFRAELPLSGAVVFRSCRTCTAGWSNCYGRRRTAAAPRFSSSVRTCRDAPGLVLGSRRSKAWSNPHMLGRVRQASIHPTTLSCHNLESSRAKKQ